jgi:hypothetical protein
MQASCGAKDHAKRTVMHELYFATASIGLSHIMVWCRATFAAAFVAAWPAKSVLKLPGQVGEAAN